MDGSAHALIRAYEMDRKVLIYCHCKIGVYNSVRLYYPTQIETSTRDFGLLERSHS